MTRYFIIIFIGIQVLACLTIPSPYKGWQRVDSPSGFAFIPQGFEKMSHAPDLMIYTKSIDSIVFYADHAWSKVPLTREEKFTKQFNAYHYQKFFEHVLLDKKVWKIFRDSVSITAVYPKNKEEGLLMDCLPCNAIAEIIFKNHVFLFPYSTAEIELVNDPIKTIAINHLNGISWKDYSIRKKWVTTGIDIDGSGVYITSHPLETWSEKLKSWWVSSRISDN